MGVYSQYNLSSGGDVAANEAYEGAVGAYQMIEENEINSYNIFESVIGRDFAEAMNAYDESVITESDMMVINEASSEGIWGKIVTLAKKIWEKIKGIINSIKTKIQSVFIRDGKELYNKYKKTINDKINNGKLSSFKFKWKALKASDKVKDWFDKGYIESDAWTHYYADIENAEKLKDKHTGSGSDYEVKGKANYSSGSKNMKDRTGKTVSITNTRTGGSEGKTFDWDTTGTTIKSGDKISDVNNTSEDNGLKGVRPYTTDETTDMLEDVLGKFCGSSSAVTSKEFAKEFHDAYFEDEDEKDNISTYIDAIETELQSGKKSLDTLSRNEKDANRDWKNLKKKAEDIQKVMQKANSDKSTQSSFAAAANRCAGRASTCLNILSKATGMYFAAYTACTKEYLKQCRSVYIKAAAYNQKKAPYEESATLLEAMADVSDYEVEEMFATI